MRSRRGLCLSASQMRIENMRAVLHLFPHFLTQSTLKDDIKNSPDNHLFTNLKYILNHHDQSPKFKVEIRVIPLEGQTFQQFEFLKVIWTI
jgi:hypothetical protein